MQNEEKNMGGTKWLVAAAMLLAATGARAQEKTAVYIAPYGGYTHLRIDEGQIPEQVGTLRIDAAQVGFSFGIRIPAGLLIEAGRSDAIHTDFLFSDEDIDMKSYYGAIGWRIPFGEGWHFTPKVGRGKWKLSSTDFDWFDFDDDNGHEINGWDNFYELNLSRQLNERISLGINFKDVDQDFGHSRSGTFVASFAF
jgi:hypothetical protein